VLGAAGSTGAANRHASAGPALMRRLLFALTTIGLVVPLAGGWRVVDAQTRFMYSSGQSVSPSYEGWWPNADGSFTLFFGYMNSNWLQEFDVPAGPQNTIEPGGPDQGQPTHFYPRRNPFLFTIRVPADFDTKELIWTLTTNGKTERAYASLKTDYQIDPQVISTEVGGDFGSLRDALRTNIPPELKVEGGATRSVKVGEPLTLAAFAKDPDNIPARRGPPKPTGEGAPSITAAALYRPPSSIVASSGPGLRLSWIVYRGKADAVSFSPDQMKTWTDSRAYANSPWSPPWTIPAPPPDNKWVVETTFQEPGTYVLRAVASDGSLFTYDNVTVTVSR
jgi:autonomous glycyl radical cofactor GrcA